MSRSFAFLKDGRLHVARAGAEPRAFDSAFGLSVRERAIEIQRRHDWKTQGRGANFMSRGLLWSGPRREAEQVPIGLTHLTRGAAAGELLYALMADGRSAVCGFRVEDTTERRLLHGSDRLLADLAAEPGRDEVACSVQHPDGTASLAVMTKDATDLVEVTEGESRDGAPAWLPGPGRRLVYHSAGVGRDAAGRFASLGRSEIHRLDLDAGQVETLAADPKADLIAPRVAKDGTLLCIRRPHVAGEGGSFWGSLKDFVLFPARLLFAIFQYLNFFTARYTGKPLTTAGGPKREGADVRQMMVWSNLMDAEADARAGEEPRAEVPRSWKLAARSAEGNWRPLADGVLAFDVCEDGALLYTTGSAVYRLAADGTRERLLADSGIRTVVALD